MSESDAVSHSVYGIVCGTCG